MAWVDTDLNMADADEPLNAAVTTHCQDSLTKTYEQSGFDVSGWYHEDTHVYELLPTAGERQRATSFPHIAIPVRAQIAGGSYQNRRITIEWYQWTGAGDTIDTRFYLLAQRPTSTDIVTTDAVLVSTQYAAGNSTGGTSAREGATVEITDVHSEVLNSVRVEWVYLCLAAKPDGNNIGLNIIGPRLTEVIG